jgi:hypothetical protein
MRGSARSAPGYQQLAQPRNAGGKEKEYDDHAGTEYE